MDFPGASLEIDIAGRRSSLQPPSWRLTFSILSDHRFYGKKHWKVSSKRNHCKRDDWPPRVMIWWWSWQIIMFCIFLQIVSKDHLVICKLWLWIIFCKVKDKGEIWDLWAKLDLFGVLFRSQLRQSPKFVTSSDALITFQKQKDSSMNKSSLFATEFDSPFCI